MTGARHRSSNPQPDQTNIPFWPLVLYASHYKIPRRRRSPCFGADWPIYSRHPTALSTGGMVYVRSLPSQVSLRHWSHFSSPTVVFVLVTFLAGSAALLLVESMASIDGNEDFQASIEYSTLADLFLGHRWHWAFQIILYIALQSQAITSLIESFQVTSSRLTQRALLPVLLTHCMFRVWTHSL